MAMGGDGEPPPAGSGPFVRSDHAAGSFWEVSKLALLGLTVAPLRLVLWLALVWPIYPICRAMYALRLPIGWIRVLGRVMARATLVLLGFWPGCGIRRHGDRGAWDTEAVLVVSNHVSWLDILFFMSEDWQPAMVAKEQWIGAPLVGWYAHVLFECVVVRRSRDDETLMSTTAAITERLKERRGGRHLKPLLVFAEGTTSNGRYLINFRTGGFRAALSAIPGQKIHCVVLQYPWRHFSPAWESMYPHCHLLRLLTQFYNTLEVSYLQPYELTPQDTPEQLAVDVRKYMAANARTPMATCDVGYEEKENFHAWLGPKLAQLSCLNRLLYVHPPSP